MNDERLAELRVEFEERQNRKLMEELIWGMYADHSGYTSKARGEFINWLCNAAYRALKNMEDDRDYKRASEQREHDILYEPTYNLEDGSM